MKRISIVLCAVLLIFQTGCINKEKQPEKKEYIYSEFVKTKEKSPIYEECLEANCTEKYKEIGQIEQNTELHLNGETEDYYKIQELDKEYLIKKDPVEAIEKLTEKDQRYKNYLVWNKNIITKQTTKFYNLKDELLYTINKSFTLPIIVDNLNERYYIEYNNQLMYVKQEDIEKVEEANNTSEQNTPGIAVLNYHFVHKDNEECNQEICTSETQMRQHLDYIKNNNYFTPKLNELELYMDNKIQLPKSVVITADDGWMAQNFIDLLDEYKLNGTYFIVTSWYDPKNFKSEYVEFHSHSHNLHNYHDCPTGQGGGIQCLPEEKIQEDLKTSSQMLNGSKYFCYPFYEYNNYSIEQLKKAGYRLAFGGEFDGGDFVARPNGKKYEIPRWVMVNYTTMQTFQAYLELKKG